MKLKYVTIERDGPVAIVKFDRKKNKNAFNQGLILELTKVARNFHDDLATQAVVITGSRDYFSTGIDLKDTDMWDYKSLSEVERRHLFYRGGRLCEAWEYMPQVTVAAIEGMAVGAGVALGLACDWRVMADNAYLYVPEVKIGLNLQWGALPRLVTLVGPARAKRIVLLCERMGANQALEWGLVDGLASDGAAVEEALKMATLASAMPATTVRMVKEAINAIAGDKNRISSFADADQSQLAAEFAAANIARSSFLKK